MFRELTLRSLGVLSVAYLVFWGCAWNSVRAPYAPPSASVPPAALSGSGTAANEVGVSLVPAAPTSAGAVWLSHSVDEQLQLFGGVGIGGGLLNIGVSPFGGLRLLFDPVESLRIGLELSAQLEAGTSFNTLAGNASGLYAQPTLSVGMPLAWHFVDVDLFGVATGFSLYTDPAIGLGPVWGDYSVLSYDSPQRIASLRLPVGVTADLGAFRAFLEMGGQGVGGMGARFVLLPVPFPYAALGASFAF